MKYNFPITKNPDPKAKPDPETLRFGTDFTDHMFIMDYEDGKGWHDGRIVPYGPLSLDPAPYVSTMLRKCSKASRPTRLLPERYSFSGLT